jgi:hypothetical protein
MAEVLTDVPNILSIVVFFPGLRVFPRLPIRDVPEFTFPEYTVQHSGCTQQSNVPSMQRSQWPAPNVTTLAQQDPFDLPVRGGVH